MNTFAQKVELNVVKFYSRGRDFQIIIVELGLDYDVAIEGPRSHERRTYIVRS